jgi:hypothetical protein
MFPLARRVCPAQDGRTTSMEFPVMSRASGQARSGAHRFTDTATGAMARMFAAWSRVPRFKQRSREQARWSTGGARQQTGSNRPLWEPTRPLKNRGGSSEGSDSDTCARLRLPDDPSRSLTLRRTARYGLVGSDTEEVTGSNPVAPTSKALTSGNAGQFAVWGRFGGSCTG